MISTVIEALSSSFLLNLKLFGLTLLFALPLGLAIAFGSMSRFRPVRYLSRMVVWAVRGTPLMLQVIIIYFGPGLLELGQPWQGASGRLLAATIAFSLNYACYFSEIYRGGIESIPLGQREAGQVLGMTKPQIFLHVTLLQVIKRIMPPMGNEIITLIKDTALANVITNKEIILMATEFIPKGLLWPLFATGIYFLLFVGILTLLLGRIEKKLDYFKA